MSYRCFLLENLIRHFLAMFRCLCNDWLRQLDVVSAKTVLSPCGLNPVFVLKTKVTRRCPLEQIECKTVEISVQLTIF